MDVTLGGFIKLPYNEELRDLIYQKYLYVETRSENSVTAVKIDRSTNTMYFPRNLTKFTLNYPRIAEYNIIDNRLEVKISPKVSTIKGFKPRDYQRKALTDIKKYHSKGITDLILEAKAGSGKSFMMSAYICMLQQKTLILVDRSLLANQMYEEITTNTNAKVQLLTKDSTEVLDVNIATFQLMNKNPKLVAMTYKEIGSIIVDETHIVAANTFLKIVQCYPARYRIGLSATPFRADGLTNLIFDVMGHHKVYAHNPKNLRVTIHEVHNSETFILSNIIYYSREKAEFLSQKSIVDKIYSLVKFLIKKGRSVLIACDSVKLQKFYNTYFNAKGIKAGIINGSVSAKNRDSIIQSFEDGETKILLAFSVLEKGISIKRLDTIVSLVCPSEAQIIQLTGRLRRDHDTKRHPIYIDMFFNGNFKRAQSIKTATFKRLTKTDNDTYLQIRDFNKYKRAWH